MKRVLLMLVVAVALVACSTNETGNGGSDPRTIEGRMSDDLRFDPATIAGELGETFRFGLITDTAGSYWPVAMSRATTRAAWPRISPSMSSAPG